ncbi:MAG: cytochrome-c peroxidase [Chitinophagaceae bacterium]
MKYKLLVIIAVISLIAVTAAFKKDAKQSAYFSLYESMFRRAELSFENINQYAQSSECRFDSLKTMIHDARMQLKPMDFWWRYADPISYKLLNGPLPVEWETEVFEKYEKPYKRIGGGLTLAELAIDEGDSANLIKYLNNLPEAISHFRPDSMQNFLGSPDHFAFCNRLFLLNLSTIYTTGFECPDTSRILPEILVMLNSSKNISKAYLESFREVTMDEAYLLQLDACIKFVEQQSGLGYESFSHFSFISDYINPLYGLNAKWILENDFRSKSFNDYSLNKEALSIFDKSLYYGQNTKGIFIRVNDSVHLKDIAAFGKQLFFDPILSGNNQRSCASCHIPEQFFTDNSQKSALQFNHNGNLKRNSPSLLNAEFNHLAMQDGKFYTLQDQALAVITNPMEMGCLKEDILSKVLSVKEYSKTLKKLSALTPKKPVPDVEHILSALTYYYTSQIQQVSEFDMAIEKKKVLSEEAIEGFNLFMSKAQCATCHFLPHFNGVKPPYVGSEFEVLGVPDDTGFTHFGMDSGRYLINPAKETAFAFRTGTLKNIEKTGPYMHNGVFSTLKEVMVFYNNGGGAGRGLNLPNQTLGSEPLGLTEQEMEKIITFMKTLNETIEISRPLKLPESKRKELKERKVGGTY